MGLQDRPICFHCDTPIESNDFVFCAPCDHEECPSVVFHPICLMEWRQHRDEAEARRRRWHEEHIVAIHAHIERRDGGQPEPPPDGLF